MSRRRRRRGMRCGLIRPRCDPSSENAPAPFLLALALSARASIILLGWRSSAYHLSCRGLGMHSGLGGIITRAGAAGVSARSRMERSALTRRAAATGLELAAAEQKFFLTYGDPP